MRVWRKVKDWFRMRRTKRNNRDLCYRYPFLIPWNRWSGKLITEAQDGGFWPGDPDSVPDYDFEYTEWDDMPTGWNIAFGHQILEELRDALIECGDLGRWRIVQLKEKYGRLVIYSNGDKVGSKVPDILDKYERLSTRTCIVCGKPATRITTGWISPFCDACCGNDERSVPIEEYYEEEVADGGGDSSGN